MAIQSPFFAKRENEPASLRPGYSGSNAQTSGTPLGTMSPSSTPVSGIASSVMGGGMPSSEGGSKLTVGPNIKLKGVEITDCDTLVVEGLVEATMDSRLMQISEQGAFKGSAEIDIAEIHGLFDGNLTVRQKLVIFATGKVTGKIRYGKLVIEEGGQIAGEILCGAVGASVSAINAKLASPTKMGLQPA